MSWRSGQSLQSHSHPPLPFRKTLRPAQVFLNQLCKSLLLQVVQSLSRWNSLVSLGFCCKHGLLALCAGFETALVLGKLESCEGVF